MRIECRSYAKINWALEVLGLRPDGYHELRTIFQTINLYDPISFETTDGVIELKCGDPLVPEDESNLIYRAAVLFRQQKAISSGVRVKITKRIPVAAGLGGGSSNAAVALMALQRLWQVWLSPRERLELGAAVGADVPFFFYGGTAVGVGRGSEVYPLPDWSAPHLLLVTPPIRISTGEVYRAMRERLQLTSQTVRANIPGCCAAVYRASEPPVDPAKTVAGDEPAGNDLESVVVNRHPEIRQIVERLDQLGAIEARMSGSGATVFARFESREALERAAAILVGEPWQVVPTRTVGRREYWQNLIREV
jgi:4-diphosphocytidyl-2-C-methyl-D-erythritol kinase